jgi:hypothetical protein
MDDDDQIQPEPRRRRREVRRDLPDEDDRPRRRRRYDDDEDDDVSSRIRRKGDATGGLIPYHNPKALIAYYLGVFSLIPCVGLLLGPPALVLGILGVKYRNKHPEASGLAHAIVGIVLGTLVTLAHLGVLVLILLAAVLK